jgi:acylphosphatase
VAFRYFVVRHARDLEVRGTVRNRRDGAVEAVLQADTAEAVEALIERIRQGPRAARVEAVEVESMGNETRYDDFEVVR